MVQAFKRRQQYYINFLDNSWLFPTVKEFSKSVNSWWSYCKNLTPRFLRHSVVTANLSCILTTVLISEVSFKTHLQMFKSMNAEIQVNIVGTLWWHVRRLNNINEVHKIFSSVKQVINVLKTQNLHHKMPVKNNSYAQLPLRTQKLQENELSQTISQTLAVLRQWQNHFKIIIISCLLKSWQTQP